MTSRNAPGRQGVGVGLWPTAWKVRQATTVERGARRKEKHSKGSKRGVHRRVGVRRKPKERNEWVILNKRR